MPFYEIGDHQYIECDFTLFKCIDCGRHVYRKDTERHKCFKKLLREYIQRILFNP